MTAIWIAVAVLAVAWCGLAWVVIEIHNESYHIRKEASETDSENIKVFYAIMRRADRQLELDNTLVQVVNLVLSHLGLEVQEPTTQTTPLRLVPKIERGEG